MEVVRSEKTKHYYYSSNEPKEFKLNGFLVFLILAYILLCVAIVTSYGVIYAFKQFI